MSEAKKVKKIIAQYVSCVYLVSLIGYLICFQKVEIAYFIPILTPIGFACFFMRRNRGLVQIFLKKQIGRGILIGTVIAMAYVLIPFLGLLILGEKMDTSQLTIAFVIEQFVTWPFAAVCEEIGWRGFLLPLLKKVTNYWNACIINAVIWFGWYVPMIVHRDMAVSFSLGEAMIYFLLNVIFITFIMGAISEMKWENKLWIFISMHAVHNIVAGVVMKMTVTKTGLKMIGEGGYLLI